MRKPPNKEQLKLRASFYNNLAVGSAISGVFIPVFALYREVPLRDLFITPFFTFPPPPVDDRALAASIATFVALAAAWLCRRVANRVAGYVDD
jgi:hypothetical protein